jgi:hypothetical protein
MAGLVPGVIPGLAPAIRLLLALRRGQRRTASCPFRDGAYEGLSKNGRIETGQNNEKISPEILQSFAESIEDSRPVRLGRRQDANTRHFSLLSLRILLPGL